MLSDFDIWTARRTQTNYLADLKDAVVAIEADWYLDRLLSTPPSRESLLPALGGLPFTLQKHVDAELASLRNAGITPIFIFNGMDVGRQYKPFQPANETARLTAEAWSLYLLQHQAESSVEAFGVSGFARSLDYRRHFQSILRQAKVDFRIAPYSARGQLAYFSKQGSQYVDAVAGSSELLLFSVDQIITKFDFELSEFSFVKRRDCIEELGSVPGDIFVDACLLAGSDTLPALPQLSNSPVRRGLKIHQALDMMKVNGGTGIAVCQSLQDEQSMRKMDYLDRFRRVRLAIKHSLISSSEGRVEPFEIDSAPGDLHLVIGQRLPDELYYYLWCGVIATRVPNQLTSGLIHETCPIDGGESEAYRILVQSKLTPSREVTLSLLSKQLTRAYQHRELKLSCWFDANKETSIRLSDVSPPSAIVAAWNVHADTIDSSNLLSKGITLSHALQSLNDPSFAKNTITKKDHVSIKLLETTSEVLINSIWRFLHMRGYLNDQHTLTPWGKVLDAMYTNLGESSNLEEAALLAVELLRHDLLNSDDLFPTYLETPLRGSETDKRNTTFLARLSCLGKLRHKLDGYTGPLSRDLLGYNSMIDAIRVSLRDLLEVSLTTMFLNGDAERQRDDHSDLGLDLPFLHPNDCALGIAMKSYLGELHLNSSNDPTSLSLREEVKTTKPAVWLPNAIDFKGDLETAFRLWDAVYAGLKIACESGLAKDRDRWDTLDAWVQKRR